VPLACQRQSFRLYFQNAEVRYSLRHVLTTLLNACYFYTILTLELFMMVVMVFTAASPSLVETAALVEAASSLVVVMVLSFEFLLDILDEVRHVVC